MDRTEERNEVEQKEEIEYNPEVCEDEDDPRQNPEECEDNSKQSHGNKDGLVCSHGNQDTVECDSNDHYIKDGTKERIKLEQKEETENDPDERQDNPRQSQENKDGPDCSHGNQETIECDSNGKVGNQNNVSGIMPEQYKVPQDTLNSTLGGPGRTDVDKQTLEEGEVHSDTESNFEDKPDREGSDSDKTILFNSEAEAEENTILDLSRKDKLTQDTKHSSTVTPIQKTAQKDYNHTLEKGDVDADTDSDFTGEIEEGESSFQSEAEDVSEERETIQGCRSSDRLKRSKTVEADKDSKSSAYKLRQKKKIHYDIDEVSNPGEDLEEESSEDENNLGNKYLDTRKRTSLGNCKDNKNGKTNSHTLKKKTKINYDQASSPSSELEQVKFELEAYQVKKNTTGCRTARKTKQGQELKDLDKETFENGEVHTDIESEIEDEIEDNDTASLDVSFTPEEDLKEGDSGSNLSGDEKPGEMKLASRKRRVNKDTKVAETKTKSKQKRAKTSASNQKIICMKSNIESKKDNIMYQCDLCSKSYVSASSLNSHKWVRHLDYKSNPCSVCGKLFATNWYMKYHEYHAHKDQFPDVDMTKIPNFKRAPNVRPDSKEFSCSYCNKTYYYNWELKAHIDTHTGGNRYKCLVCDKIFHRASNLKRHSLTHEVNNQPYSCSYCPQRFTQDGSRKNHERKHTGETMFSCDSCGMRFERISNKTSHQEMCRINLNLKPVPTESTIKQEVDTASDGDDEIAVVFTPGVIDNPGKDIEESSEVQNNLGNKYFDTQKRTNLSHCKDNKYDKTASHTLRKKTRINYDQDSIPFNENETEHVNSEEIKVEIDLTRRLSIRLKRGRIYKEDKVKKSGVKKDMITVKTETGSKTERDGAETDLDKQILEKGEVHTDIESDIEDEIDDSDAANSDVSFTPEEEDLKEGDSGSNLSGDENSGEMKLASRKRKVNKDTKVAETKTNRKHKRVKTSACYQKIVCTICGKLLSSLYMKDHIKFHEGKKDYHCDLCGKSYVSSGSLNKHKMIRHLDIKSNPCTVCGKQFATNRYMKYHEYHAHKSRFPDVDMAKVPRIKRTPKIRPENKEHNCSYCDKKYYYNWELKAHIDTHTGGNRYQCLVCEKIFHRASNLKRHSLTHEVNNQPYSCSYCPQRFTQDGSRKVHERKHTGEAPFLCDLCGMRFRQKSNKTSHQKMCRINLNLKPVPTESTIQHELDTAKPNDDVDDAIAVVFRPGVIDSFPHLSGNIQ